MTFAQYRHATKSEKLKYVIHEQEHTLHRIKTKEIITPTMYKGTVYEAQMLRS